MKKPPFYKNGRRTIEKELLLMQYDGFYAQACQGQLIYGGGEFNMRQSN